MKTYLEPEEIKLLEGAATNARDQLLIRILYHLGCRVSEALALAPEDIDLNGYPVRILHLKRRIKVMCSHCSTRLGKCHTFCPGCGQKVESTMRKELEHHRLRTLPLDKETAAMLRGYIQSGGPVWYKGGVRIFGINRHRAWQITRELAQRVGLPRLVHPESGREHSVSPHRLRDAFAVIAVKHNDSGDGLRLLQEHLGHVSFNTTAKYRKVAGEELKEWFGKLWNKEKRRD